MTLEHQEGSSKGSVVFTSQELPNNETITRHLEIGGKRFEVQALSRKGLSYSGEKKASEDACVVLSDGKSLQVIVVDGGTQIEKVPTLDEMGLTGGRYIATKVEELGKKVDPSLSVSANLKQLNAGIGKDIKANHPSVTYKEHSKNTPYGSIAAVKVDIASDTLEVANAGDVFVAAIGKNGVSMLLTVDDVYKEDQESFAAARRLADKYGVSFKHVMQNRTKDPRFIEVQEELEETMRQGNIGLIRRITGAPNFDVTSSVMVPLSILKTIYLFTDGGVPPGFSFDTREGIYKFFELVNPGLEGLSEEVKKGMLADPDYENTHVLEPWTI